MAAMASYEEMEAKRQEVSPYRTRTLFHLELQPRTSVWGFAALVNQVKALPPRVAGLYVAGDRNQTTANSLAVAFLVLPPPLNLPFPCQRNAC